MKYVSHAFIVAIFALAIVTSFSPVVSATPVSTVWFGGEDNPSGGTIEGQGDYNDIIFSAIGNFSLVPVGSPTGAWQSVAPFTINENGSPYWDNPSQDGSQLDAGYFMTGTGGFTGNSASPNIPQSQLLSWMTGAGAAAGFNITGTGSGTNTVLVTVAGNSGSNQIILVDRTTSTQTTLFNGAGAGATASMSLNSGDVYALDMVGVGGVNHYSDVINVSEGFAAFTAVPEPATFGVMGVALLSLGLMRKRVGKKQYFKQ